MSVVGPRSLDISAVMMVPVMASVSMQVKIKVRTGVSMRVRMRVAYASAFDIPCADVGVADFPTTIPFRNACKMVCCICFPAYIR